MKAIKNITDVELHKSAKKRKNSHENEPKYSDGYVDGANDMREMAIKENHSLREKITELKIAQRCVGGIKKKKMTVL